MRAMRLSESAQAPVLIEEDVPRPQPQRGDLLVRVHAVGVTPTELLWYPTTHAKDGAKRRRAILGHEFSGVVAAVGGETEGFSDGQEVYGMNDWFADGAMAEYCITHPGSIARKPSRLTHVEAAAVPIGALTAWQGLFDRATLRTGERVLVHGGAGAIGTFAIQLARSRGARVSTTVSAWNLDFVAGLGAEQVIDYHAVRFEDEVSGMDVVFDTVGGETLQRSWGVLRPGGRLVTVAADSETTTDERVKRAFFIVEPSREQLIRVGELLESGELRPVVDAVIPLAQAAAAFTGELRQRRGRGKLVATVAKAG
jgi:NADPH:quinone reductase-like Zn-dependent oxidoreductase